MTNENNATTEQELEALEERLAGAMLGESPPGAHDPPFRRAAREADRWARERYAASRELLRQHGQDDGLRELLASLEWSGREGVWKPDGMGGHRMSLAACPRCQGLAPPQRGPWADDLHLQWGHRHDCALKAALGGREAAQGANHQKALLALAGRAAAAEEQAEISARNAGESADRAASLANRCMVAEGQRDRLRKRVADLERTAQVEHEERNREARKVDRLQDRIAELEARGGDLVLRVDVDADEIKGWMAAEATRLVEIATQEGPGAREAQLYRLRYARALRVAESAQAVIDAWDAYDMPSHVWDRLGPKVDALRLALNAFGAEPEVTP